MEEDKSGYRYMISYEEYSADPRENEWNEKEFEIEDVKNDEEARKYFWNHVAGIKESGQARFYRKIRLLKRKLIILEDSTD